MSDTRPYALSKVEPPLQLRQAILEQVSPTIAPKPFPWAKIIASATALVALYLGLDNLCFFSYSHPRNLLAQ